MSEPKTSHECRESRTCCCSQQATEPDWNCPIHGDGEWPPRCEVCGKFMRWPQRDANEAQALPTAAQDGGKAVAG